MTLLANQLLNQLVFYACNAVVVSALGIKEVENFYMKCFVLKDIHFNALNIIHISTKKKRIRFTLLVILKGRTIESHKFKNMNVA